MKLGNHTFPDFDADDAFFGARRADYPDEKDIPEAHRRGRSNGCKVFTQLFFDGGNLFTHGLVLKDDVDEPAFYSTLRALMSSFEPKHEIKEATCGWLIEECTDPI
jgi:hypothetical protein